MKILCLEACELTFYRLTNKVSLHVAICIYAPVYMRVKNKVFIVAFVDMFYMCKTGLNRFVDKLLPSMCLEIRFSTPT